MKNSRLYHCSNLLYYKELDERFKLLFYNLTAGIDYMERTFIPAIEQTSD